jgi:uncharacterized OB-fold protein
MKTQNRIAGDRCSDCGGLMKPDGQELYGVYSDTDTPGKIYRWVCEQCGRPMWRSVGGSDTEVVWE